MSDTFKEKEHLSPISIIFHIPHPSFSLSNFSKVGRPQISTSNPQICRLSNLLGLRNLQIFDWQAPIICYLRIWDLQTQFFCGLNLQQIRKYILIVSLHELSTPFLYGKFQEDLCNLTYCNSLLWYSLELTIHGVGVELLILLGVNGNSLAQEHHPLHKADIQHAFFYRVMTILKNV